MNCTEPTVRARSFRQLWRSASLLLVTTALLVTPTSAPAQSNADGSIYGRVAAPSGATLSATNLDTGLRREATPAADGEFRFGSLPTGRYTVTLKQPGKEDELADVVVSVGTGSLARFTGAPLKATDGKIMMDKVSVSGSSISPIDMSTTESSVVISADTIAQLPVGRSLNSVALLAPGTSNSVAFGQISFSGSSAAENAYYVNGFNISSFRNGLGFATVPFQFYDNFQIKSGGYSAEFGRSTGGVQNSTTKRGSNKWEGAVSAFWSPDELSQHSPSLILADGTVWTNRANNKSSSLNANLELSGPVIKDKLFVYGLYNARKSFSESANTATANRSTGQSPFWGGKIDWNITNRHTLELTAFGDRGKTNSETFGFTYPSQSFGASRGINVQERGGSVYSLRYNGIITENFSLSLLAGKGKKKTLDSGAGDAFPLILDARVGAVVQLGKATTTGFIGPNEDIRKAYRLDGEYTWNSHRLRFGVDREDTKLNDISQYSGGLYWRYIRTTRPNQTLANGAVVPAAGTDLARLRIYQNGGGFQTLSTALFVEDNWKLMDDRLLLNLGLRNEAFDNRNVLGKSFIKLTNQLAPRLGASYDLKKDGKSKLSLTWGRYHLPIAANTNVRLAGAELYYEEYYNMSGLTPDSLPNLGTKLGGRNVFSDGSIKDPRQIVDHNIKPMYQDETILSYQRTLNKNWTAGLRGIYRDLVTSIEDVALDETLNTYARANGISTAVFNAGGNDYYVLTNPGRRMTVSIDFGDGKGLRDVTFSPAELKFPTARRQYWAAELFFERIYDGKWFLQGSYTLSRSWGNSEGLVRSDNGQTDAGLTTNFDHPGLNDGSTGDLPNDHRHKFKAFGAYNVTRTFRVGTNLAIISGQPINAFGYHPTDPFARAYGAASFYNNGQLVPRGSAGRTPLITTWDLGAAWTPDFIKRTTITLDLFNPLNLQRATSVYETAEQVAQGTPYPAYKLPSGYQSPRSVRLSFVTKF